MTIDDNTPVFYQPGRPGIIDIAVAREGIMRGGYSGETLEEIAIRYPGAQLGKLGPVAQASDDYFRAAPVEITEERFREMLEVLPPEGWVRHGDAETFKLSERTSGTITAIFCRLGARFFEMQDSITTSHGKIVQTVRAQFPEAA